MQMQFTRRQKTGLYRAFLFVVQRRAEGATDMTDMREDRESNSCRNSGGALNSLRPPALGHALLQYFVDNLQRLTSRNDSHILMKEARNLRAYLVQKGYPEKELPKLIGSAGHQWFSDGADIKESQ